MRSSVGQIGKVRNFGVWVLTCVSLLSLWRWT